MVDSSNSLHSLPRGGLPRIIESIALMKSGCSLSLPAGRAVCLTKNGAYPTVLLSAASTMLSYGFAKKPARSRSVNRMRKEFMILQHPRFRMLFRFPSFRKAKRPMPLLPCRTRLRIMTIHIWFRSRPESFLCSCAMEQIRLLSGRSCPFW